jgi:hypothetical protein
MLPRKFEKADSVSREIDLHSGSEKADQTTQKKIGILRYFRSIVYKDDSSLIVLEKQAFGSLDKDKLEKKLRNIFRIENI